MQGQNVPVKRFGKGLHVKVSISSWGYRTWFAEARCDMMGFIDEVKRHGADGFEIFPAHIDQEDPASALKRIARRAADEGLEISSLIAGNDFALHVTALRMSARSFTPKRRR